MEKDKAEKPERNRVDKDKAEKDKSEKSERHNRVAELERRATNPGLLPMKKARTRQMKLNLT